MQETPEDEDVVIRSALQKWFGYERFRGQQETVIRTVLAEKHALVIMPTGMGKSLCFQIPALVHGELRRRSDSTGHPNHRVPLTLVLSPLIALMKDQVDALRRRKIDATFVNSSLSREQRIQRYRGIAEGHYDLLYVTPERFRKEDFVEALGKRQVTLLAVDEAHCISEWGHDFRPDYTRVQEIRERIGNPTTIALTATATPTVQSDIIRQLGLTEEDVTRFHEGINRPNLRLDVVETWGDDNKLQAIEQAWKKIADKSGSGIVYFVLIKTLEEFSRLAIAVGIPHVCYHGDLDRGQRRQIQNRFMKGQSRLVFATNAFGMGIDKEDIRFVLHAECPGSMEAYYQEIGRAGRDGEPAECRFLYDQADLMTQMEFIRWSNPDRDYYQTLYQLLVDEPEQIQAFGDEWLRSRLHVRGPQDHRLETALAMMERHGTVIGTLEEDNLTVVGPLAEALRDVEQLDAKRESDQRKLLALVEYVRCAEDRMAFIHHYFGLPYTPDA
ncbi:MAG: RecQ family ATP-dependent DNA helicase [Pirellulaceae bacterium]